MTVENKFVIDSPYFLALTKPLSSRSIHLDNGSNLQDEEVEMLKELETQSIDDKLASISANLGLYLSRFIGILNKSSSPEIVGKVLDYILKFYIDSDNGEDLTKALIDLNKIDKSLPFSSLSRHLKSTSEVVQLQSSYLLTVLILTQPELLSDDVVAIELFDLIDKLFKTSDLNLTTFASQLLVKLLSIKQNRELYWSMQSKYVSTVYHLLTQTPDLQLRYNLLLLIWLLTFNEKVAIKLPELFKDIVFNYLNFAKDSIKEKIARLSIATLLNFVKVSKNESIIKLFLYERATDIFTKLNERKWADEDLKEDITQILEILNDAIVNLTTFDEYEMELSKKKFNWSPPHKSEEFWIDNIDKFKQNNFKVFKQLIQILDTPTDSMSSEDLKQHQLNQTIICHDLGMIVKHLPETIKFLEKNSTLKYTIMNLMNSTNSDVKYEALKTTQILVSYSFNS